jgi:hypothetical protein
MLSERMFADLEVDRVLTGGAVHRRYMPDVSDREACERLRHLAADGVVVTWVEWVALTARARSVRPITFVARQRIGSTPAALRHLAGLAEMRWQLKAVIREWIVTTDTLWGEAEQPDAIAEDSYGCLAIEYDTGAYSARQVRKKSETYQRIFGRQLWGVPHEARRHWLRAHLPSRTSLLLSPWW